MQDSAVRKFGNPLIRMTSLSHYYPSNRKIRTSEKPVRLPIIKKLFKNVILSNLSYFGHLSGLLGHFTMTTHQITSAKPSVVRRLKTKFEWQQTTFSKFERFFDQSGPEIKTVASTTR